MEGDMADFSTGVPVVVSGEWPAATLTPGRVIGIDMGRGPDLCTVTIWKDGRVIDSGPAEDFDPATCVRIR
jgi:hypothetical protein